MAFPELERLKESERVLFCVRKVGTYLPLPKQAVSYTNLDPNSTVKSDPNLNKK